MVGTEGRRRGTGVRVGFSGMRRGRMGGKSRGGHLLQTSIERENEGEGPCRQLLVNLWVKIKHMK